MSSGLGYMMVHPPYLFQTGPQQLAGIQDLEVRHGYLVYLLDVKAEMQNHAVPQLDPKKDRHVPWYVSEDLGSNGCLDRLCFCRLMPGLLQASSARCTVYLESR